MQDISSHSSLPEDSSSRTWHCVAGWEVPGALMEHSTSSSRVKRSYPKRPEFLSDSSVPYWVFAGFAETSTRLSLKWKVVAYGQCGFHDLQFIAVVMCLDTSHAIIYGIMKLTVTIYILTGEMVLIMRYLWLISWMKAVSIFCKRQTLCSLVISKLLGLYFVFPCGF